MCAGFSSDLANVPVLEITKRELVSSAYLIWNRLPYVFVFAHECRWTDSKQRTFLKASQGFVSIK